MENINKTEFQQQIETCKKSYLDQYEEGLKKAGDKNYFRAWFNREVLQKNQNQLYNTHPVSEVIHFRNEMFWLNGIVATEAIKEYCKAHNEDVILILTKIAEYEGIILAWQEINKTEISNQNTESETIQLFNPYILLNERTISKIDFIRIINALYEIKAFVKADGTYPSKQDTMEIFGKVVGINLSNYDKDLSKALNNSSLEVNVEIFKKLENKITSLCTSKR